MNHLLNRCMEYTIQNDLDSLLKLELGLLFTYIQWWIPLKKRGWCFQHLAIQYTQCKSIRIILWLNAGHCGPSLHEPTLTHTLALDDRFYPSADKGGTERLSKAMEGSMHAMLLHHTKGKELAQFNKTESGKCVFSSLSAPHQIHHWPLAFAWHSCMCLLCTCCL